MAKHLARQPAPRGRRRLPLGLAALVGLNVLAMLAVAQGSVPNTPASGTEGFVVSGGAELTAVSRPTPVGEVSRDADRAPLARTGKYKIQQGKIFKLKPEVLAAKLQAENPTTFRVATFNVLGHSHTVKGGNKPGYADSAVRMRSSITILNNAGIDVAGLQEFQSPQLNSLNRIAGGTWDVFPGVSRGKQAVQNSIIWRQDTWSMVSGSTIGIPYFSGNIIDMPYVLLQNRSSGQKVWFMNFHNPADVRGPAQRWRDAAVARETALVNQLHADGTPVVMTGDFNDREQAFCAVTARAPMQASLGGSTGSNCIPPPRSRIDWIFGTLDFDFSGHVTVDGGLVNRVTDHPFVYATATLD